MRKHCQEGYGKVMWGLVMVGLCALGWAQEEPPAEEGAEQVQVLEPTNLPLYNGNLEEMQEKWQVELGSWGSGSVEEVEEYGLGEEGKSLKVHTLGYYRGARLDFKNPPDISEFFQRPLSFLELEIAFLEQQPATGGVGMKGPGVVPGGVEGMGMEMPFPGMPMPGLEGSQAPGRVPTGEPGAGLEGSVAPGIQPGMFPGMQPGMFPGMQPGQQPGTQPGQQPRMFPGMQPGMFPGMQPGMFPGMQPGQQPGTQPGAQPGMFPGMQPGAQPGMQPGQLPGMFPGMQQGMPPGQYPGMPPGQYPGMPPGQYPRGVEGMPMPGMGMEGGLEGMEEVGEEEVELPGMMPGMVPGEGVTGRPTPGVTTGPQPPATTMLRIMLETDEGYLILEDYPFDYQFQPLAEGWTHLLIPLDQFLNPQNVTPRHLKRLVIFGDNEDEFYIGRIRFLTDDIPIILQFVGPREVTIATGEEHTFQVNANGGTAELRYKWDFGDGNQTQTEEPTVKHTYEKPGKYRVTVTAIDKGGVKESVNDTIIAVVEKG